MNIIKQNPFRVLGLPANAAEKAIQRQIGKIKAFSRVGKKILLDYDLNFLGEIERNENTVQQAASKIEQADKRLFYSLFWFVQTTRIDEIALNYLKDNQINKAIEIWSKLLDDEVSQKNCSALQNISTLYIAGALNNGKIDLNVLQKGIAFKNKLLITDGFAFFSKLITDNLTVLSSTEMSKRFIDEIINLLQPYKIPTKNLISLFDDFPNEIKKYVSGKFTEQPVSNIENNIEKTKNKRNEHPGNAYEYGKNLYKTIKSDIVLLKNLLGKSNLQFHILADKVANEILQCSVVYFNENQEINEIDFNYYLEKSIELVKLAKSIAISKQVKDRAEENLSTLLKMKDRALNRAIVFLLSVKEAYETNKRQIERQIKEIEENDIEIRLGFKSINWTAVEEDIQNSINWHKVNEMLIEILSYENLKAIKHSDNNERKKEFLNLLHWSEQTSLRSSVITKIIDKYKKIPPKLPFKIISSEVINTDNKPLHTKHIRYIGLKLNVEVTKKATVTFYLKYIKPDGKIDRNSKTSPEGYTFADTETIDTDTKTIYLSSWGNAEKCTYDIGKHKIEVYVEDYLIHTKEFVVDIAPSEKLKKQLQIEEEKLQKINNTQFFKKELAKAKYEMEMIKQFQLFRSRAKKEKQIAEQQKIIDDLLEKAKEKKQKLIEQQTKIINEIKLELKHTKY